MVLSGSVRLKSMRFLLVSLLSLFIISCASENEIGVKKGDMVKVTIIYEGPDLEDAHEIEQQLHGWRPDGTTELEWLDFHKITDEEVIFKLWHGEKMSIPREKIISIKTQDKLDKEVLQRLEERLVK